MSASVTTTRKLTPSCVYEAQTGCAGRISTPIFALGHVILAWSSCSTQSTHRSDHSLGNPLVSRSRCFGSVDPGGLRPVAGSGCAVAAAGGKRDQHPDDRVGPRDLHPIDTYSSFIFLAMIEASFNALFASLDNIMSPPETLEKLSSCLSNASFKTSMLMFSFLSKNGKTFSSTSKIAFMICSFSIC